jgi:hypothetical protein
MKKILTFVALIVLLASCSQQVTPSTTELNAQAGSWQKLGGALDYTVAKNAAAPKLVLDRSGNLVAAWMEDNGGWRVYLERWNGTSWESFGAGSPASIDPYFSIAFDSSNSAVVGFHVDTGSGVAVYRRDAQSKIWKQLGTTFTGTNAITADKDGAIYSILHNGLKFDGTLPAGKNLIRRWNGSNWQTIYTFQKRLQGVDVPVTSLLFKANETPVVSWTSPSLEKQLSAWNGTTWDDLYSLRSFLTLDKKDQRLGFTILEGRAVFVVQGSQNLGGELSTSSYPLLAVDNTNRPVIALGTATPDSNIIVKRWTGSAWAQLGGILDRVATRNATIGSIIADSQNTLYAAWQECIEFDTVASQCKNNNIYVSKYVP